MSRPPRLARFLLEARLQEPTRTWLVGDLEERFHALARRSPLRAWAWYWRQTVLALVLPVPGAAGVPGGPDPRSLGREMVEALRSLRRRPESALAAVLTLGVGIGVVATAFSIVWGTVVAGLPFDDADRLVHFERARPAEGEWSLAVTPHDYLDWRERQRSFQDLGAYVEREVALPTESGPPERRVGVAISASSFGLLRVEAALGRTFTEEDQDPGGAPVILLSHRLWTGRYGSDPDLVGSTVVVDGRPTTVVGVMPEGFGFPIAEELWVPLRLDLTTLERGEGRLDVFGRLREGVTLAEARTRFSAITEALARDHPGTNAGVTASLRTFQEEYVGEDFRTTVYRLLAGALLLLVVCCANVANLLLARGLRRRGDLAVRQALGATRAGLARQLLAEALLLSAAGGVLGLALASWGVAWFNRAGTGAGVFALPHGSDSLFWWDVSLNLPTVLAALAVAGITTVLAGLLPALSATSSRALGQRGGGRTGPLQGRIQRAMVLSQLALTTGLLVAAGFVVRSVDNVSATAERLVRDDVLVLGVSLPASPGDAGRAYGEPGRALAFARELEERLEAEPGVSSAAFTTAVPLRAPVPIPFRLEEAADGADAGSEAGVVTVSPEYFRVFGVEAEEGRLLRPEDGPGGPAVAVVNRTFARQHLGGRRVLGARLRLGGPDSAEPWVEIVGVVPDLWERPQDPTAQAGLYLPLAQVGLGQAMLRVGRWGLAYPTFAIRTHTPGALSAERVRDLVFALDADLPVRSLEPMGALAERSFGRYRVWGRFWLAFAATALLLATLGVYGVLSFTVARRTGEIGIRRALGASAGSVQRDVIRRALVDAGVGVALGLWAGSLLARAIRQVLYGVDLAEPGIYLAVAGLVGLLAVAGSWWPALRAARVDPQVALRAR